MLCVFFFFMIRRPPRSTRTDTPVPTRRASDLMLFQALDVSSVLNGVELRQTKVWPEISAPFCLLIATNRMPETGAGFRLISPRLETSLNASGTMRIAAHSAEIIATQQLVENTDILKRTEERRVGKECINKCRSR